MARGGAQQLHHHVDADGMNVGAEALGMVQAAVGPDVVQAPAERFLADVLDQFPGTQTITKRQTDDVGEVRDKVRLCFRSPSRRRSRYALSKAREVKSLGYSNR